MALTTVWYSWLRSISGRYVDFSAITSDALRYTAHAMRVELTAVQRDELTRLAGIVSLPVAQRLADATSDRTKTIAWLFAPTPQELNSSPIH